MDLISADDLRQSLDYPSLIDAIDLMFRDGCTVPVRHHHTIDTPGDTPGGLDPTLLLMPAWRQGDLIGVKIATVFPENGAIGLPAVMGSYLLIDGKSGAPLALLDGAELTARRTASASALASRYLSRPDATNLLMVGTGVMAPQLIAAHAAVRPLTEISIWGRDPKKAATLATTMTGQGLACSAVTDLQTAVAQAHIISCATLSRQPLIKGDWLRPGQHLDLVGAFTPQMRESDDQCVIRARLFCDTRDGALKEAGDLTDPLARGVITADRILGDLFDLARGQCRGREGDREITLFKSTGTALEDLAAAKLAFERCNG
jgi:ornithine cyclodeaminase